MSIEIREISTRKGDLKRFIKFTNDLYKENDCYVPPLVMDEINLMTPSKNPAFDFCESIYFMAYRDGKAVGRIAGIINHQVNEKSGEKRVRFGMIDFIDDIEVSRALISAVEQWGKSKGLTEIVGPLGFCDMDKEGMLIEGYDELGTMATIYNYPYYPEHMEQMGFEKAADWHEFKIYIPEAVPEKHQRISDIVAKKFGLSVVKYTDSKKLVKDYGYAIFDLINEAYKDLFGYSTLTQRQIDDYIKQYLPILRLDGLVLIVDKEKTLIGVGITLPSMSRALQKSKGKLFPLGWYHMIKALRGKNTIIDLMLVAVKPEYQGKGVNAFLFSDLIPVYIKNGIEYGESNPELELNNKVQAQWQYFDTKMHKRRRAFKKSIEA
ncbi:MAG: N-acetyltransferase [Bacteroidales bacterium]